MKKRLIYLAVGLAVVFFSVSLVYFITSGDSGGKSPAADSSTSAADGEDAGQINVKIFYFSESSVRMVPVPLEMERREKDYQRYALFIEMLLQPREDFIVPVVEGVQTRTVYFLPDRGVLVIDFTQALADNFPGGSRSELQFVYYFVNNLCYNFKEIKSVKIMIAGNDAKTISGHLDLSLPFFPDFRMLKDEQ